MDIQDNFFKTKLLEAQMLNDLYLIEKGVRNSCRYVIEDDTERNNFIQYVESLNKRSGDNLKIWQDNDCIYIYKYDFVKTILEYINNNLVQKNALYNPQEFVVREFLIGKILGYSDETMEKYFLNIKLK